MPEYRLRRARSGIVKAFLIFAGTTLITTGLVAENLQTSLLDKLIQLGVYVLVIAASVIFDVGKNYEKGAFGVPNELAAVNGIWAEFEKWTIPQWVIEEIENESKEVVKDEQRTETKKKKQLTPQQIYKKNLKKSKALKRLAPLSFWLFIFLSGVFPRKFSI